MFSPPRQGSGDGNATFPVVISGNSLAYASAGHATAAAQAWGGTKTLESGAISTVATGNMAMQQASGARLVMNGATANRYVSLLTTGSASGAICFFTNGSIDLGAGGLRVTATGFAFDSTTNPLEIRSSVADGAGSVATIWGATLVYSTFGAKVVSFGNVSTTYRATIGAVGGSYCITTHGALTSPGDSGTSNTAVGTAVKDTSGTTYTLTNSVIAATSKVIPWFVSADSSAIYISAVPGAGSCVFTFNSAPAANCTFGWFVVNV